MTVWTADSVTEARRLGWDTVLPPDDLFRSPGWLSLEGEQTNIEPRYYLAGDETGGAEAAMSCYPLDATSEPWPFMRVDRTIRMLADRYGLDVGRQADAALDALLPTYLCGGRRVPNTAVLTAPELGQEQRRRRLDELVGAAEDDALAHGVASVSFLFVRESDHDLRDVLKQGGYVEFPTARYSTLHLDGTDFKTYLESLPSDRRRKVRYERRQLEAAEVRFADEPLSPGITKELVPLLLQHGHKYGHTYTPEAMARNLALHAKHCGPDARVITARSADGVVRGFSLVVRRGSRLYIRQTGYDYEWQGKLPVYFALCFYEPIEYANRIGATVLDYAVESEKTKRSRGCVLEQRFGYLKAFDESTHAAAGRLVELIRQAQQSQ
ncbi:GNAT family N-acetyltransferase [Streptomyces sp. NPDC000877]|uniref:GNAT family N-acetyltransferase n=1 Tax=unclassified Streptomyces TaxID=2593676 RepID=UPI0033344033